MEINKMFLPNEEILNNLKDYISKHSSVETWVGRSKVNNQNPMIVFKEARNELFSKSTTYDNTTRIMNYNIDIYCHTLINSYQIILELVELVSYVMQEYYHMNGGLIAIIDDFDGNKNSFLANLKFTTRYIPNKNKLY